MPSVTWRLTQHKPLSHYPRSESCIRLFFLGGVGEDAAEGDVVFLYPAALCDKQRKTRFLQRFLSGCLPEDTKDGGSVEGTGRCR